MTSSWLHLSITIVIVYTSRSASDNTDAGGAQFPLLPAACGAPTANRLRGMKVRGNNPDVAVA